ncbi:predicted protein [Naegleria gruberi]|uniref:Predicted protein n=1 Tax=Naegleria gruberi TaxID=5762 RepID=D2W5N8_NAEGR|nr:uncharacterized protein NAEGRDRAFT_76729 [Naegleria gruberi]EFC35614.1 predicted protein [Naegleria gruberi]|eukprot:XP_002668358.1 predicted protein [Naegleria gruberi strain NEG-M]
MLMPKLLFRATRDGFRSADFHRHCDGKLKTVTIIKSDQDDLFGFYATRDLASNCDDFEKGILIRDDESFTFRLENDKCYTFHLEEDKAECPLVTYDSTLLLSYAYCFWISDQSDVKYSSSQEDVELHILPQNRLPGKKQRYFSEDDFLVKEIEVFHILD